MGNLDPTYYDNLLKENPLTAPVQTKPAEEAPQIKKEGPDAFVDFVNRTDPLFAPGTTPMVFPETPPKRFEPDRSVRSQTAKFGDVVGTPEYYRYKAEQPYRSFLLQQIGSAFGMRFPDQETWDKMSVDSRLFHTATEMPKALGRMIKELPREIVKTPIRIALSTAAPWQDMAEGKSGTLESIAERESFSLPWLGNVDTYFKTFDEANKSGLGKWGATLMTVGLAAGDVAIAGALGEAVNASFRPRAKLAPGETITDVKPIQAAFIEEKGIAKAVSNSEYYTLPKTIAKKNGGHTNDTFIKVTPAGENSVEVAVVRSRSGAIPKTVDYVKNKFGVPEKNYAGDFGPEIKVQSQIVKVNTAVVESKITKLFHGGDQPLKEFKSASQLAKELGDEFSPSNIGGRSNFVFFTEGAKQAEGFARARAFNVEGGKGKPTVTEGFVKGKIIDLNKYPNEISQTEAKLFFKLADDLEKKSTLFIDGKNRSSGIGGADGRIIGELRIAAKRAGTGEPRRTNIDFIDLDQSQAFAGVLEKNNISGFKFGDKDVVGRHIEATAIVPSKVKTKTQIKTEADIPSVTAKTLDPILPKALKGFERSFVTEKQMSHMVDIAKVNGIEPGIRDAVIRTVTGKKAWGEMTQTEYVNAAQTLAKFNNIKKYAPDEVAINKWSSTLSPARHWTRAYEEKGGLPIYSDIYVPIEEGIRLRNVFRNSYRNQAREVFGKYQKAGFGPERRLIKQYMEGNTNAITGNPALKAATKNELIKISGELRKMYDDVGQQMDVPPEIFLKDYQPHIQDIGGVYQLYKEGTTAIPKEMKFFAKFKRHGNVDVALDDALGLFDIYVHNGSNRTFLNPALERAAKLGEKLPKNVQKPVKSYVLEKMGYAGKLEQYLDTAAVSINRTLNTNLPPDTARQLTTLVMDTTYSGALGANPGKAVRNLFQTDMMTYPRLGPKFYGRAAKAGLDPKWHAEVRSRGFLVELGVPFGEELAKDITLGGKVGNTYRKVTQGTLGPYSMADQVNRVRTYAQTKMLFEDSLAKYNKGKITWKQLEKDLDFNSLGKANRQIVRQRLVGGDIQGAFENIVREVLDETHFPYRRGSSSRITYGLGGKIGTQFLQWPIEFAHTQARWIRTGQFDKIIRFWGASSAMSRSFKDAGAIDTTNFMFYNSLANPDFSPMVRSAIDLVDMINNSAQKNSEKLEKNKEDLARAIKSLGVPVGAEIQNVISFKKSYFPSKGAVPTGGPIGPDGNYPVYTQSGKLKYYATFSEIWLDLWGFTTPKEQEYRDLSKDVRNDVFDRKQAKKDVMNLFKKEKYDQASEIIGEYGINITPKDFDQYLIPMTQRTFNKLPDQLKAKFAPRVFPTQ